MGVFKKSVSVPYSKAEAFDLVSDVRRYPEFIKWITAMRVSQEVQRSDGSITFVGDAAIGFKGFSERFSTHVIADQAKGDVTATLVRGPFKHLIAIWSIRADDAGQTIIALNIDYEFKNIVLRVLAAANEDMAANKIMDAFLNEAQRRYVADC